MHRRRVLAVAGLALAGSLAGCSANNGRDGTPEGTAALPIRFWLEPVSLSAAERESVNPIVYRDLTDDEQAIVETALEAGEYTEEPGPGSPALERLRDRIEERTGNGETLEVYLRREGTYYRVGFADGDHIIAHPDH